MNWKKIFLWLGFPTVMLLIYGYRNKKKWAMYVGGVPTAVMTLFILLGIVFGEFTETETATDDAGQLVASEEKNTSGQPEVSSTTVAEVESETTETTTVTAERTASETETEQATTNETTAADTTTTAPETTTSSVESSNDADPLSIIPTDIRSGKTVIEVYGGDRSGVRQPNVIVDIGFGDKQYYAVTNGYGQLTHVYAKEIFLQDEANEPVNADGRYYDDEANVAGCEHSELDQGHVIADSLSGVANSYNVTPQHMDVNRHGDQAYMESVIRDALYAGIPVTDYSVVITYPDNQTMIPSHYEFSYIIGDTYVVDSFPNIIPDDIAMGETTAASTTTKAPETTTANETTEAAEETTVAEQEVKSIEIIELDKRDEYVIIKNTGTVSVNMQGWVMLSEKGAQSFTFPSYVLEPGQTCKLTAKGSNGTGDFSMSNKNIWNNSDYDPAILYDATGTQVDKFH